MEVIDANGQRRSGRDPIDVPRMLARVTDGDVGRPLPPGTQVGHVHLHVADLLETNRFYTDVIGFIPEHFSRTFRMADQHAGGTFRHRMAFNTWQGDGAPPRPDRAAGLRSFTIRYKTIERLRAALERLPDAKALDGSWEVRDPSGTLLTLTA